jgi:hypothetical protein
MLLLASIALVTSSWTAAPSCPTAFGSLSTTIGAVTSSSQLTLCASQALLVRGSNGSLNLVLGSSGSISPRCLVYPNGLSLDLTHSLLSSGHVGCWSLYPPSQTLAIVNVGKPSEAKVQSALKVYKPEMPKIFYKPSKAIQVGTRVSFSTSAKLQILKTTVLGLPAQIRFKPSRFRWTFLAPWDRPKTSSLSKPTYIPLASGDTKVTLTVSYSVEYSFTGVTPWRLVKPDIVINAGPLTLWASSGETPKSLKGPPKLVNSPCVLGSTDWRC